MGIKLLLLLSLALLPLQDRMKTWQMKHRHPDPRYLSTQGDFPEVDNRPRTWAYTIGGHKPTVIEVRGKEAQRPDASAQVDEIRAQLWDKAKESR